MKRYFPNVNIESDFYHSDIPLHHRSVCFFANELSGDADNLKFYNDGLTLDGGNYGVFISDTVYTNGSFDMMTASWNAKTYGGTVKISVSIDGDEWFSWGVWSDKKGVSSSENKKSNTGEMDIDILTFEEKHSQFRFKIELTADKIPPVLYSVSFAVNTEYGGLPKTDSLYSNNPSPTLYQCTVPEIGGRICSPTCVCMALNALGEDINMEKCADGVYDSGRDIYGNWSFNSSFPGCLGYNSFFDLYDADALKYALSCGVPVICSVRIKEGMLAKSGYPERKTNGHLLLVTGYVTKNCDDWLYINDPARKDGKMTVLLSEFMDIWRNGAVYIIQKKPERCVKYLSHGTKDEIPIIVDIIDKLRINRRYERGCVGVKYIVIHNTGNFKESASAEAHRHYLKGFTQGQRPLSWHYTVDDERIYKSLPEEESAYHAGDGAEGDGNLYGVGIEICLNKQPENSPPTEPFIKAVKRAAILTAELMKKYSLTIDSVRQHNSFSGKNCPSVMRQYGMWEEFLSDVMNHYNRIDDTIL